ncbi:MAG: type II toxin-antitoxin system HicB family antitoxin [Treponema sp.]|jgi:predicted RNase H-like HicB family nuclease|nr:type II toxin-antitoxin system HicB family antitoxin [Treponema sp.]
MEKTQSLCYTENVGGSGMDLEYTYWQDGDFFVGFLNDYPDDSTQGVTLAELEEALIEVYEIRKEEKEHLARIRKFGKVRVPA